MYSVHTRAHICKLLLPKLRIELEKKRTSNYNHNVIRMCEGDESIDFLELHFLMLLHFDAQKT